MKRKGGAEADRPMNSHALDQASALLRRLAFQVNRTAKAADVEAVHDLRVSIRRLRECLRVFGQFFPGGAGRKVRVRLDEIMGLASQVRDRDIALAFLEQAAIPSGSAVRLTLTRERKAAAERLKEELKSWTRRDFSRRWRAKLAL